jgi:hypothetical protein
MFALRKCFLSNISEKKLIAIFYKLYSAVFLYIFFVACTPHEEHNATLKYHTNGGEINQLLFKEKEMIYGVGGKEWKNGFILRSQDGGNSWQEQNVVESQIRSCVWSTDGWIRACGLGAEFHQFNSLEYQLLKCPQARFYRGISQIDSNKYIVVGGEAFHRGFIELINLQPFHTSLLVNNSNELDDIISLGNGHFLAIGFGVIIHIDLNKNEHDNLPIHGDHFIDICNTEKYCYVLGVSGSVWKIEKLKLTGENLRKDGIISSLQFFRSIHFKDDNEGIIAGDNGLAYITNDGGKKWVKIKGLPEESILCLTRFNDKYWYGTYEGNIYIID